MDWLGRFVLDPEALELKLQERGLTTVQEVCVANLSVDDFVTLGVTPKWRCSSMLRGISETIGKIVIVVETDEALVDWLGRFDANPEALEPNFQERGLTTVLEVSNCVYSLHTLILSRRPTPPYAAVLVAPA